MVRWDNFDALLKSWSLPWKTGAYNRTTFQLNPSRPERLRKFSQLASSYSMKAVYIKGAPVTDHVYITTKESRIESHVFAPTSAQFTEQAPVIFTTLGKGYVGYIGDVNAEDLSTPVVLGMCNLVADGQCQYCGKNGSKRCARCETARYCSRECQAKDWKEHKLVCQPKSEGI